MEFSFGEQMKMLLKRNNMTIQDLADLYTEKTGVQMSRQNLTQRLKRDNFPEQDMRIFASLLGYQISIELSPAASIPEFIDIERKTPVKKVTKKAMPPEPLPIVEEIPVIEEIPVVEKKPISEETSFLENAPVEKEIPTTESTFEEKEIPVIEEIRIKKEPEASSFPFKKSNPSITFHIPDFFRKNKDKTSHNSTPKEEIKEEEKENYVTNTVRKHPHLPGYLQVYERETNTWSDVKEDEFWAFQEKKKQMLGKDYQPPIIL